MIKIMIFSFKISQNLLSFSKLKKTFFLSKFFDHLTLKKKDYK